MTDVQRLEIELEAFDIALEAIKKLQTEHEERRYQVWMKLNRARRLEREELQDDKRNL